MEKNEEDYFKILYEDKEEGNKIVAYKDILNFIEYVSVGIIEGYVRRKYSKTVGIINLTKRDIKDIKNLIDATEDKVYLKEILDKSTECRFNSDVEIEKYFEIDEGIMRLCQKEISFCKELNYNIKLDKENIKSIEDIMLNGPNNKKKLIESASFKICEFLKQNPGKFYKIPYMCEELDIPLYIKKALSTTFPNYLRDKERDDMDIVINREFSTNLYKWDKRCAEAQRKHDRKRCYGINNCGTANCLKRKRVED